MFKIKKWQCFLSISHSQSTNLWECLSLDSISLVVVVVVSNKPFQRLELHQFRDEIISLTSSLCKYVDRVAGNEMGSKLIN